MKQWAAPRSSSTAYTGDVTYSGSSPGSHAPPGSVFQQRYAAPRRSHTVRPPSPCSVAPSGSSVRRVQPTPSQVGAWSWRRIRPVASE